MTTSQTHRPAHGGYPGAVPEPIIGGYVAGYRRNGDLTATQQQALDYASREGDGTSLDLRKGDGGYRVRVVDPEYPIDHPVIFGSESEEYVATFAGLMPECIVFVTEEALS